MPFPVPIRPFDASDFSPLLPYHLALAMRNPLIRARYRRTYTSLKSPVRCRPASTTPFPGRGNSTISLYILSLLCKICTTVHFAMQVLAYKDVTCLACICLSTEVSESQCLASIGARLASGPGRPTQWGRTGGWPGPSSAPYRDAFSTLAFWGFGKMFHRQCSTGHGGSNLPCTPLICLCLCLCRFPMKSNDFHCGPAMSLLRQGHE